MKYKYTESEIDKLSETLVVLCDTREQKNSHIIKYLSEYKHKSGKIGIPYKNKKLDSGDYSFYLPKNPEYGILRDIYFDKEFMIEKKKDLNELSGNLTANRDRFKNEFTRCPAKQFHLLVEDGSWMDIYKHRYTSKMPPNSYSGSLISFILHYNIHIYFIGKEKSPEFIWQIIRQYFKQHMLD